MTDEKKSYSVKQVADMHGISESRVREYIKGSALPPLKAIREGTKYLIPVESHSDWWEERLKAS